jgi:hypothetical protein
MANFIKYIGVAFKGICMGAADVIPASLFICSCGVIAPKRSASARSRAVERRKKRSAFHKKRVFIKAPPFIIFIPSLLRLPLVYADFVRKCKGKHSLRVAFGRMAQKCL